MIPSIPMKDWRFLGCTADYADAAIVLFGAPFDGTVSYRAGTRFGPQAARSESFGIETWSPYQLADLENAHVCDLGDIDVPIGNTPETLRMIGDLASEVFAGGKKLLMMGGEHLVSFPAIKAAYDRYPELCVIHFDAHADLREDYLGEKNSHASAIRRVHEVLGDGRIWQFGIRSGTQDEFQWAEEGHTDLHPFGFEGLAEVVRALAGKPVYLTVDLDVLDSSVFPGTGTPEAGGVTFRELMEAFGVLKGLNIVGADAVELSPPYDPSGGSTAVACKVIRELALLMA